MLVRAKHHRRHLTVHTFYQVPELLAIICLVGALFSLATSFKLANNRPTVSSRVSMNPLDHISLAAFGALRSGFHSQNPILLASPGGLNIQDAINALPESGGIIELSPGVYTLTASISMRSNVTIEGPRSAIVSPEMNFGAFTNSESISNVTFHGFTLKASGIALANVDQVSVESMAFLNTESTAVNFMDPVTHISILDNYCEAPTSYFCFAIGSSASPNPQDSDWIIRGNTMQDCAANCILVRGGKHIVIAENIASGCGDTCIEVGTGTSQAVVSANVVDTSASTTAVPIVGISTRSSQHNAVVSNSVNGNPDDTNGNCYLAWHGSETGESQAERYNLYVGNVASNCFIGFKTANANHFTVGAFDFSKTGTAARLDRWSLDHVELPSRGDARVIMPTGAHLHPEMTPLDF